ncbi:DMT family transporter [Pseudorhodoplanes sinuspersici]|nr:DMT family transporter [Pseudorhodoplanes sinuspersici]RKE74389.1 drug/metabolite transporter (DMT)-like permease [Pseudorhodoplanes sinuspersici]
MAAYFGRIGGWLYHQAYLLVALTYLFWALNIVIGRHAMASMPPVALSFWRWALAALILLPFTLSYLKRDWPVIRANLGMLCILGLTGTTGYAVASYWGLQYTQAINGLLIQCTMPIIIGVTTYFVVGDKLSARQMSGIAVSFFGVLMILLRGDPDVLHAISFNRGDMWFAAAVLIFAFYSPLTRKYRPPIHPMSFLAITIITGTLLVIPLFIWESVAIGMPTLDMHTALIFLYMAIFPSIIAYICFNRAIQLIGPNLVAALYPLIVVFGVTLAIVFLGERPEWYHFIGTIFIVGGVLLATRQRRAAVAKA